MVQCVSVREESLVVSSRYCNIEGNTSSCVCRIGAKVILRGLDNKAVRYKNRNWTNVSKLNGLTGRILRRENSCWIIALDCDNSVTHFPTGLCSILKIPVLPDNLTTCVQTVSWFAGIPRGREESSQRQGRCRQLRPGCAHPRRPGDAEDSLFGPRAPPPAPAARPRRPRALRRR